MMKFYNLLFLLIFIAFSGCNGCSKSAQRRKNNSTNESIENNRNLTKVNTNVIKMKKVGGVFHIPVKVNGIEMTFIFDTGASIISISQTEALFLYKQGSLTDDDIIETANFIDANGDISEGTIINLKTIEIGNKMLYNVRASIVHNLNAPLLFGQSALENFGSISIDNNKGEITFE